MPLHLQMPSTSLELQGVSRIFEGFLLVGQGNAKQSEPSPSPTLRQGPTMVSLDKSGELI